MSEFVLYTDKRGKQHSCTNEEWAVMEERQKKFKVRMFTYVGPFEPVKVQPIGPIRTQVVKAPEEITVVRSSEKQGADASPRKPTASK